MKFDAWAKIVIGAALIYAIILLIGLDIIVSSPQ